MITLRKSLYSACLSAVLGIFAFVPNVHASTLNEAFGIQVNSGFAYCGSGANDISACRAFLGSAEIGGTVTITGSNHNDGTFIITNVYNSPDFYISWEGMTSPNEGGAFPTFKTFDLQPVPPPPPAPITALVNNADTGFASSTGFTIASTVEWSSTNLIKLFIGSGLSLLYNVRYWIVAMMIMGAIIIWGYLAFRFFRH